MWSTGSLSQQSPQDATETSLSRVSLAYRRRQVEGSIPTAKATAELLRTLITRFRHPDAAALLTDVRNWGIQLQAAKPLGDLLYPSEQHHVLLDWMRRQSPFLGLYSSM